ncbi:hypothetical protein A1I_01050 [Rickettsia bellii OSU 85-389]|nr:hypothetical protein A1I_01050 [Rickettsia bellii OSU 85-389]
MKSLQKNKLVYTMRSKNFNVKNMERKINSF